MEWITTTMGAMGMIGWETPMTAPTVAADTFLISFAGWISTKAANTDEYTMDHQKQLMMITDGLK